MSALTVARSWRTTSGAAHRGVHADWAVATAPDSCSAAGSGCQQTQQQLIAWEAEAADRSHIEWQWARQVLQAVAGSNLAVMLSGDSSMLAVLQHVLGAGRHAVQSHLRAHEAHISDLGHTLARQQHIGRSA